MESIAGVGGFVILAGAIAIGVARHNRRPRPEVVVHRMIGANGPVETFDLHGRPSSSRISARGEALVSMLARKHMAGHGSSWFEPASPLVFELDSGDIHVIAREHIKAVERYQGDGPQKGDAQVPKITLSSTSPLWFIIVYARLEDLDEWLRLPAPDV